MADWWNTKYFIRQNVKFTSEVDQPVKVGYPLFVTLDYNNLISSNKVRPDFADIQVVYYDGTTYTVLPKSVSIESSLLYVRFNAVITFSGTTSNYWVYMGNAQLTNAPTVNAYTSADYSIDTSSAVGLGLTYTRPTEDWLNGLSLKGDSRATFTFYGVNTRLVVEKGPNRGILELTVDNAVPFLIDCYAITTSQVVVYTTIGLTLGKHYIRMRVTGQKNPSSSDGAVQIIKFQYSKYTQGDEQIEEIYSSLTPVRIVVGP